MKRSRFCELSIEYLALPSLILACFLAIAGFGWLVNSLVERDEAIGIDRSRLECTAYTDSLPGLPLVIVKDKQSGCEFLITKGGGIACIPASK